MVAAPVLTHDDYAETQTQKLFMSKRIPVIHTNQPETSMDLSASRIGMSNSLEHS